MQMTFYMLRNKKTKEWYRRRQGSSPAVWTSLGGVGSARGAITKHYQRREPAPEFETVTITAEVPE
jgi:hypothetical protein